MIGVFGFEKGLVRQMGSYICHISGSCFEKQLRMDLTFRLKQSACLQILSDMDQTHTFAKGMEGTVPAAKAFAITRVR